MRIGIDCRLSGSAHAGIGRYIDNLIKRLPVSHPEITWVYFVANSSQATAVEHFRNVEIILTPIAHYSLSEQLRLPRMLAQAKLDLLHVPHFNVPMLYRGKVVVTIHDLLWHEYKGSHVTTLSPLKYWLKYAFYKLVVGQAVKKATVIYVPAETVKKTVLKYYPKAKTKIMVTKEGIDEAFAHKSLTRLQTPSKNLVYVGSLYPHKNLQLVIKALPQLPDYTLILIGARNIFQDNIRKTITKEGVEQQVVFKGYVPDHELETIFSNTQALVQPSLSEGFGLTGIEAMAMGVPVLASNIPIFQEIYQDGAIFFDPHSVASFVKAVSKLEQPEAARVVAKGRKVALRYSWDSMVIQTVTGYQQVIPFS